MMVDFKWIQISLFLVAELQFTAAVQQLPLSFTVRVGDDVTLSCKNVMDDQQNCDRTTWLSSFFRGTAVVSLVERGQIVERDKSKSDRLSVTGNCSLVIKEVAVQDVGRYTCRQFDKSGQEQGPDSVVLLSVVIMTEQKDTDVVTLSCSVSTYEPCRHTVKWLLQDRDVDKHNKDLKTSQAPCSASVNFLTSHFIHTSKSKPLKCEVTDGNKEQKFPFSLRPSGEKPGEETTTTKPTTTEATTTTTDDPSTAATESTGRTENRPTTPAVSHPSTTLEGQWWLIALFLGVVVLIIITVAVIRWKRTNRNQRQADNKTADPEDDVSYISVTYTKTTNRKGRTRDDDDEAVTYSAVKPSSSSSSAGASADPSSLYATINKPNK